MKNLRKHISIFVLLCIGFLILPSKTYACNKKTAKTEIRSYSNDHSSKTEKKDCCKTKSCKRDSEHNDCNGKCKHSSCRCSTSSSSLTLPIPIDLKTTNHFATTKKQKFGFKQAYYSSGYSSIWQPPKIS